MNKIKAHLAGKLSRHFLTKNSESHNILQIFKEKNMYRRFSLSLLTYMIAKILYFYVNCNSCITFDTFVMYIEICITVYFLFATVFYNDIDLFSSHVV